jgi:AraC-like DNA-binding protein
VSDAAWYQPVRVADDLARDLVTGWVARPHDDHDLVPDGCVDVLWISNGTAFLCGPETTGWTFALPAGTEAVGVRFRPGRAASALGLDAVDLRDRQVRLDDVVGSREQRLLIDEVGAADPGLPRVRVLESYARGWLAAGGESDPVADQVARLLGRDGTTSVSTLVRTTELSERQLHRRCVRAFAYGPATLRRILRLQRFLRLARHPSAPASLAVLSALAGYADQQHLARDCRAIARTTPSALVRPAIARSA